MNAGSRTAGGTLRYDTILKLASGGMATVYVGTVRGALGFRQIVAIKKPHPHLLDDPAFRKELLAEARLASMIRHANVVDVRDVEVDGNSISLVMDYIEGASLGELLLASSRGGPKIEPHVAVRIVLDACAGLQAAHELTDEKGRPLGLVHRDISPQNILVGTDGVSRVTDFGVAKCVSRSNLPATTGGALKGKLAYMAPEYLRGEEIDRRFDVFGMGVVLWEALTARRLFRGGHEVDTMQRVLNQPVPAVSEILPSLGSALDAVVAAATQKEREHRFQNISAMAAALESSARSGNLIATTSEVASLVARAVGADLEERRVQVRARLAATGPASMVSSEPATTEPEARTDPDPERAHATSVPPTVVNAGTARGMGGGVSNSLAMAATIAAPLLDRDIPATLLNAAPIASTLAGSGKIPSTLDDPMVAPEFDTLVAAHPNADAGTLMTPFLPEGVDAPRPAGQKNTESDPAVMRTAFAPYDRPELGTGARALPGVEVASPVSSQAPRVPTSRAGLIAVVIALGVVTGCAVAIALTMKSRAAAPTIATASAEPVSTVASSVASAAPAASVPAIVSADSAGAIASSTTPRTATQKPIAHPAATPHSSVSATHPTPKPTSGPPPNPY